MTLNTPGLDPALGLCLSMVANKGVYALLLGSGVSRAARIPTGWEITLDLIRKLAVAKGADCGSDPAAWYRTTFSHEPDYSDLLKKVGRSPEERQQLLRGYFEPTTEERDDGWKQPTQAHKAIARLVAGGYVKIILTTNFDRLVERAIEEAGITPTVISTPEAIAGSLPLIHQRCCIVKLHGDYLDTRIRNTPEELAAYHDAVNRLLDRVLDDFGLIVCGWSGVWDTALRAAIDRCPSRRFTTYWACASDPAKEAAELIQRRGAQILRIKDADTLFSDLAEKTEAVEASSRPHPLSTAAAVASLKKFISEDRYNVQLHDLLFAEAERVHAALVTFNKELLGRTVKAAVIPAAYSQYRDLTATLLELFVNGCYWSRPETDAFFVSTLQQLCRTPKLVSGPTLSDGFNHYPAVLLLYAGGLASLSAGRVDLVAKLFSKPMIRDFRKARPIVAGLDWSNLSNFSTAEFPGKEVYFPLSEHLFLTLRHHLGQYAPDDGQYDDLFDRYEYLQTLVVTDLRGQESACVACEGPIGRFAWKSQSRMSEDRIIHQTDEDISAMGANWPPLKAGLFAGSLERLDAARTTVKDGIGRMRLF